MILVSSASRSLTSLDGFSCCCFYNTKFVWVVCTVTGHVVDWQGNLLGQLGQWLCLEENDHCKQAAACQIVKSLVWIQRELREDKPDVLVRELGSCSQCFINILDLMMFFISRSKTFQNSNGFINCWLRDFDRCETPFQRRIFLDMLPVFIMCGGPNTLATRNSECEQKKNHKFNDLIKMCICIAFKMVYVLTRSSPIATLQVQA
jgi:hypothetical protein